MIDAVRVTARPTCAACGDRSKSDLEVITLIRDALAFDRLRVDAQPIVGLSDGDVVSEELLLRIATEDGDLIFPEEFLSVAERHGLMPLLDRFVVERAAMLAAQGRVVHVNLSATTLTEPGLFDDIISAMHRQGADPSAITFEITESAAASDMVQATHVATRLAARGFRIAIDDFGCGWGAFRYLRALPISVIKIDREFVLDLCSNPKAVDLMRAIVALARVLGHETVAEGVEDDATLDLMRDLGVDYAQGFHCGRPAPTDAR